MTTSHGLRSSACQDAATADHWALRDAAARLVRTICLRFADPLHNIQPRISKTLVKALLDRSKPVTTHYGAPEAEETRAVILIIIAPPLLGTLSGSAISASTCRRLWLRVEPVACRLHWHWPPTTWTIWEAA